MQQFRWAQLCGKRNQPSKKVRTIETGVTLAITTDINMATITGNPIAGKRTPGPVRKRKRDGSDNAHDDDDNIAEFSEVRTVAALFTVVSPEY